MLALIHGPTVQYFLRLELTKTATQEAKPYSAFSFPQSTLLTWPSYKPFRLLPMPVQPECQFHQA